MQKKLYIYSNFDFTKNSAGKTRMLYYSKALAKEKVSVYLVSCCSNTIKHSDFNEVDTNIWVQTHKKDTKSLFGTITFLRNLYRFSKSQPAESSFLFYPSPLIYLEILSLIYLKGLKGQRVFNELNEIRKYSSAYEGKYDVRKPVYSFKKLMFKNTFSIMQVFLKSYSGLICISTAIQKYGMKYNNQTLRVPILTDPFNNLETSNISYAENGRFNIGFSGSIKPFKENLENFIQVLLNLGTKGYDIQFNLCGPVDTAYKNYLIKSSEGTSNISLVYHGNLNTKELNTFLSQQNLLVIPRGYTLQNHYGFSTKLSDYLNQKKAVLITDVSDNSLFIEDGINGFIVPPNDNDSMQAKLAYIIDNFNGLSASISANAEKTSINSFYYKNYAEDLRKFLFP